MVLAMSRPWRDPQTGTYYLRQRVPKDLAQRAGQAVIKVGLGTKDPVVAKQRHAHELAKLSERWRIMREGIVSLNELEAHALARLIHESVGVGAFGSFGAGDQTSSMTRLDLGYFVGVGGTGSGLSGRRSPVA